MLVIIADDKERKLALGDTIPKSYSVSNTQLPLSYPRAFIPTSTVLAVYAHLFNDFFC